VGDAADTLRALEPLLRRKSDRTWQQHLIDTRKRWEEIEATRAHNDAKPLNPQRAYHELSPLLPDACVISSDAGSNTNWAARYLHMRRGMKYSLSGGLATMGAAVPYAIAAKFAFPERVALAITGDGAMQMNGNAELITIAKYWKRWIDSPPRKTCPIFRTRVMRSRSVCAVFA
jgi:pyruvate dehydrogenase (quinone)